MLLLNRRSVTAGELAERFGVSVRTVYRDIGDLSSAGMPVFMTKGRSGGISLLEEYSINKAVLSESERDSLAVALKTMKAVKYPEIETVLNKIGAVFKSAGNSDWVKIDFTGWDEPSGEPDKFTVIRDAILRLNVIGFDYVNAGGERSVRLAEPEQLYFNRYTWYLIAFCLNKNERRVFRVTRMRNITVSDRRFVKRAAPDGEDLWPLEQYKPLVDLRLRFAPRMLFRIYDYFNDESITKNEDGTYDVRVALPEDDWLYGFIMSFGPFVEVLEPERLRVIVAEAMRKALKFYE